MVQKADQDRGPDHKPERSAGSEIGLEHVRLAVAAIRFGEVRVVIQNGVIVQIDRIEKQRLR
jgi:hypothetical protein